MGTSYKDCHVTSESAASTELLGEEIGRRLKGGEVIELVSDLGGGKTTFVRGLARGLGCQEQVSSPTFKLSNVYKTGRLELQHFDFYRLNEAGIVADELAEVIAQPDNVVVIEWGEIVHDVLPQDRLTISIKTTGETSRKIELRCPATRAYLVDSLNTV